MTNDELFGQYFYTGQFDRSYPEPEQYIEYFKINLLTGKVQIAHEHSGGCSFEDSDDFILTIDL